MKALIPPPGNSGISSATSKIGVPFNCLRTSAGTYFTSAGFVVSPALSTTFVSTIAAKSLTLTLEIFSTLSETSGRAKAVTAMAATGST